MARRFVRSSRQSKRRLTEWSATTAETAYTGLAAATAVLDSVFTTTDPETIIRVVGQLSVQSDQIAASETPFGAVGLCVVSDQAAAIGITAIPTPYTDAGSDLWFLHQFWACPIHFGDATGFSDISARYELSSKAMRKISEDETICLVMENGSATKGVDYRLDIRTLNKVA